MLHAHKKLGKLLPFGGHIELEETPWESIIHELKEESGYDIGQLKILQPKSRIKKLTEVTLHPYPICYNTHNLDENHLHTDAGYAFVTREKPRHKVAEGESNEIIEIKQNDLSNYDDSKMSENIKEIYKFILEEALYDWDAVETSYFS